MPDDPKPAGRTPGQIYGDQPAYPRHEHGYGECLKGATLREVAAVAAMQGLINSPEFNGEGWAEQVGRYAVEAADALMSALAAAEKEEKT